MLRKLIPIAAFALACAMAAPAQALISDTSTVDGLAAAGTTDSTATLATVSGTTAVTTASTTTTDAACKTAVLGAGGSSTDVTKNCVLTMSASASAVVAPTTSDITAMKAADSTLTTATASARRCRTWKQWYTAGSYHEQHIGKMCYDHVNVYASPWGGYHVCGDWWGIGYTASDIQCFPIRVNDSQFQGGYYRQQWDWVHWTFLIQGSPLAFTRKMHANIFPSGTITFHNN